MNIKKQVKTLRNLHQTWGHDRLAKAIGRSPTFVEQVFKADEVSVHCKMEGVAATPSDAIAVFGKRTEELLKQWLSEY